MSRQEVIASEHAKLRQLPNGILAGEDRVNGLSMWIFYEFAEGKLARAQYALKDTYSEPNQYIIAASELTTVLNEKYGHSKTQTDWRNNLYRNDLSKLGFAVSAGHVVIKTDWETDRTTIRQMTVGNNFSITLVVRYTSKQFGKTLDKQEHDANWKVF